MTERVLVITGRVAPLDADDVDTDQIIPAQYLKVTEKKGLSRYLFYRWRYDDNGELTSRFVLDRPEFSGSAILAAGRNFGIGSSRENAVWALLDAGVKCVLASSFGDIFYSNASRNGLLCVRLDQAVLSEVRSSASGGRLHATVSLADLTLSCNGVIHRFQLEPHIRERLMSGADDISLTLSNYEGEILGYEAKMQPYLKPRTQRPLS